MKKVSAVFIFFCCSSSTNRKIQVQQYSIPAQGSSKATGGLFRGNVLGNAPNIADPLDGWDNSDPNSRDPPIPGRLLVYRSAESPGNVNDSTTPPSAFKVPDVALVTSFSDLLVWVNQRTPMFSE